jgi:hypothetical protein
MRKRIFALVAAGVASRMVSGSALAGSPASNGHNCAGVAADALVPPGWPPSNALAHAPPTGVPTALGFLFNCGDNGTP